MQTKMFILSLVLLTLSLFLTPISSKTAYCQLSVQPESGVKGNVLLVQESENDPTWIVGNIYGLVPGYHGFHLMQSDNFTQGCYSAGNHFNPEEHEHGGEDSTDRHVGDLGNILADLKGVARFNYHDRIVTLYGDESVIGLACVVHEYYDDLGLGAAPESTINGNTGGRLNCGHIVEGFPYSSQ